MEEARRANAVRRLGAAAVALIAVVLLSPAAAGAVVPVTVAVGHVYTETNDPTHNQVIAFDRHPDGTLTEAQRINTGGQGAVNPFHCGLPPFFPACPIIDSQGAVALNLPGTLLFAVNAGSNTVSSFRVTHAGLQPVDQVPSGGSYPESLDTHGDVLYVLNEESGNIQGFTFTSTGHLTPISGSNRPLATPGPGGSAAQIGFDRTGRVLAVTERTTSLIDTFVVSDGVAGPATAHHTPGDATTPFGFAFDRLGHLAVADALSQTDGAATGYRVTSDGGLAAINTQKTAGGAPCWVVITPTGRYVYITNTTTKSVARFRQAVDGTLTFLGITPTLNTPPAPVLFPTDEAISRDGRFLYVLVPSVLGGPAFPGTAADSSRIDEYRIGFDGSLAFLGSTPENMPPGVSGLAAR